MTLGALLVVSFAVVNVFFFLLYIAIFAFTVYGAVAAGQNGHWWWMISMIVGGLLILGWIPAVIYLLAVRPHRTRRAAADGPGPSGIP